MAAGFTYKFKFRPLRGCSERYLASSAAGSRMIGVPMTSQLEQPLQWSKEIEFTKACIEKAIPRSPGLYRILQSGPYPRYKGTTRVLKIGKSDCDLRQEVLNHLQRHTAANRLARVRNQAGIQVTVTWAQMDAVSAGEWERALLREFEDSYWDLPLLNSQRGYDRDADAHYRHWGGV